MRGDDGGVSEDIKNSGGGRRRRKSKTNLHSGEMSWHEKEKALEEVTCE